VKQLTDKFAIAKRDIESTSGVLVQKDDVGIIEFESKEISSIFFIRIWQKVTLNTNDFVIFDVKKLETLIPTKFVIFAINS